MGLFSPKKHYLNQVGFEQHQEQPKRISTSAGHRLSVILENGGSQSQASKAREAHRASVRKSGLSSVLADVPEDRSASAHSSGYSYNVWSENEKFAALRNNRQIAKRGGWKRILIALAVLLLLIIALAVGLAFGLKKKHAPESSSPATAAPGTSSPSSSSPASPASDSPPSPTSTSTPTLPPNFPLGTYSLITFLDTIQTNCTANPLTWTCYPYTNYYDSPSKSLSTFTWTISGSPSAYKISSTSNPFTISFKNAPLTLLDPGLPSERYRFQISATKSVSPATNLTEDNAAVNCDFRGNLQANLYTKMGKEYPGDQDPSGDPSYATWPFAVKIEESAPGGQGVPNCYKTSKDGQHGEGVEGLEAQSEMTLCSCLYKNWHTPS